MRRSIVPPLITFALTLSSAAAVFDPDINGTGLTMDAYMVPVPGGGEPGGPVYTYRIGKYEITNQQLVDFLNDAELDSNSGSPTGKSSNMVFYTDGSVFMDPAISPWEKLVWIATGHPDFDLGYDPGQPFGSRYSVNPGKETFPARHISWAGACKFCNWLTIDQGLGEDQRCYTEGIHHGEWHPVTISTADWWGKAPAHNDWTTAGRDLNDEERECLVRQYRGYRLPMDDADLFEGNNRPDPDDYNEWIKAAAWDPAAPDTFRTNEGASGPWDAVPDHWMYGFGRDDNTGADANWRFSGDPFDPFTVPVDYYDGTDHGGTFATNDTNNQYGLYGMSGNIWEYCQDYGVAADKRSVRGGSFNSTSYRQAAASCYLSGLAWWADLTFGLRVLRVDGAVEHKIGPGDPGVNEEFGRIVAISGDHALVGAQFDNDNGSQSGSAYLFKRDGTDWIEQAELIGQDVATGDRFGRSVAISGRFAVIGAPRDDDRGNNAGAAYVFRRDGTAWAEEAKLLASDGAAGDELAEQSVAIWYDVVVLGAPRDSTAGTEAGSAYVFRRTGGTWGEEAELTASSPDPFDHFGQSVAVSGDVIMVGANNDDDAGDAAGAVYVFCRTASGWSQQDKLTASDPADTDFFGWSLGLHGDRLIIGAPFKSDGASFTGAAYLFEDNGAGWTEQAKLTANEPAVNDFFGWSVSVSGDRAVVGSLYDDHAGNDAGAAQLFWRKATGWVQQTRLTASDADDGDQYGQAAAICGNYVLAGSPYESDAATHAGAAYVYDLELAPIPLLIDADRDFDIDLVDYDAFNLCSGGPAVPYPGGQSPDCAAYDADDDGDVDHDDFGGFQKCYGGDGEPYPPGC